MGSILNIEIVFTVIDNGIDVFLMSIVGAFLFGFAIRTKHFRRHLYRKVRN